MLGPADSCECVISQIPFSQWDVYLHDLWNTVITNRDCIFEILWEAAAAGLAVRGVLLKLSSTVEPL